MDAERRFSREEKGSRRDESPRGKTVSLSKLLGREALKPPKDGAAPKVDPWKHPLPQTDANGEPLAASFADEKEAERTSPPSDTAQESCKGAAGGWCVDGETAYYRDGDLWGRLSGNQWSWLRKDGRQWWLWTSPQNPPLLWHQDHWWEKNNGTWFLIHDGEPWGYRYFEDWNGPGLQNASGVKVIYSGDGGRVAVVTPDQGAKLYEASSGKLLAQWRQEDLPKRRSPHLPTRAVFD